MNTEISGWNLEGVWLPAAPYIVFKVLRHGWEAVPFQNFRRREFFSGRRRSKLRLYR